MARISSCLGAARRPGHDCPAITEVEKDAGAIARSWVVVMAVAKNAWPLHYAPDRDGNQKASVASVASNTGGVSSSPTFMYWPQLMW